jgi:two-component system response regulator MprA
MARILIIDDHADVRDVLESLMASQGYEVDVAPDGRAGLERCDAAMPDLVITDLHMPELDGLETVRELRERSNAVKIISMTGGDAYYVEKNLDSSRIHGADRTFSKPFDVQELLSTIEDLLTEEE